MGETTRPDRYNLNQISYEYAVVVTNRFKGLELVSGVPEELCTEVHNIVQRQQTNPPKGKEKQESKMVV